MPAEVHHANDKPRENNNSSGTYRFSSFGSPIMAHRVSEPHYVMATLLTASMISPPLPITTTTTTTDNNNNDLALSNGSSHRQRRRRSSTSTTSTNSSHNDDRKASRVSGIVGFGGVVLMVLLLGVVAVVMIVLIVTQRGTGTTAAAMDPTANNTTIMPTVPPSSSSSSSETNNNNSNNNNNNTSDLFFLPLGPPMDGDVYSQHGLSLSSNEDGTRWAVADYKSVHVYEIKEVPTSTSTATMTTSIVQLGPDLYPSDYNNNNNNLDYTTTSMESFPFRSSVVVELSNNGDFVAIGWPLHDGNFSSSSSDNNNNNNNKNVGMVEVYRYNSTDSSGGAAWQQVGNSIFGTMAGAFFGASISLSDDGGILAVGATGSFSSQDQTNPNSTTTNSSSSSNGTGSSSDGGGGGGGYAQVYTLNQGVWYPQGQLVTGAELQLQVYSVSLSGLGTSIAVSGIPTLPNGAVAKVFQWYAGDWTLRGTLGIGRGDSTTASSSSGEDTTSYLCAMSADGTTVAVSNYYVSDTAAAESTSTSTSTRSGWWLSVRAMTWSDTSQEWELMGNRTIHGNSTVELKSGYFISISRDGRRIAMGDPGRRLETAGATGHAHIFEYQEQKASSSSSVKENDYIGYTTTSSSTSSWVWTQLGPNIWGEAAGDQFGYAVSLSGNGQRLGVSAPFNRGQGQERGRFQVIAIASEL
jgi:hypothetical protein